MRESHRALHAAVSKATRDVEAFLQEEAAAASLWQPEHHPSAHRQRKPIASAIVEHYALQGRLELASAVAADAGVPGPDAVVTEIVTATFAMADGVRRGRLGPAVRWAADHSSYLRSVGSSLEFDLHALRAASLLAGRVITAPGWSTVAPLTAASSTSVCHGGLPPSSSSSSSSSSADGVDAAAAEASVEAAAQATTEARGRQRLALRYIRSVFPSLLAAAAEGGSDDPFTRGMAAALRRLAGAVATAGDGEGAPEYADLFAGQRAEDAAARLESVRLLAAGLDPRSALSRAIEAGRGIAPRLDKVARVVREAAPEAAGAFASGSELPVEARVPDGLLAHSVFVCPVTRQQCGPDEPPVLLPCGHLVSEPAVRSLLARGDRFACPLCMQPARGAQCVTLDIPF